MITLTREEAQQILDVIERNIVGVPRREVSDFLRAQLALHDMNKAAEQNGEEL